MWASVPRREMSDGQIKRATGLYEDEERREKV